MILFRRCPSCDVDLSAVADSLAEAWLKEYQAGSSATFIAAKYNVAHSAVLYVLKKKGIAIRSQSDKLYWTPERFRKVKEGAMKGGRIRKKKEG